MSRTRPRANIPKDVRRDLWIAAAGRCEFQGCNRRVDRDFLTKARCNVGEYAHIIADSPAGPRGIPGESERLAKDPSNLMLTCKDCHTRIDQHGQSTAYTKQQLQSMKRKHEERIELIYSSTGVHDTLPIIMKFPIGNHIPNIDLRQVVNAILENSDYSRFPLDTHINIDKSDFDIVDRSPDFWPRAEKVIEEAYQRRIEPAITERNGAQHVTIAAFAPIPMLMKLGAELGDKTSASVLDNPGNNWLWETRSDLLSPRFTDDAPRDLPVEVSAIVSVSNRAIPPDNRATVEFRADEPGRGIIQTEEQLLEFRRQFDAFLLKLTRAGARILHLHPATPICASIEIGRMILPKTFEEVHVWEWQAPDWHHTLRIV